MKAQVMRFVKVRCKYCRHLNLIPAYGKLTIEKPIKCENCGKVIARRDKKYRTIFFYGDTVIG